MLQHFFSNSDEGFWRFYNRTHLFFCETIYCGKRKFSEIISSISNSDVFVITDRNVSQTKFFKELIGEKFAKFVLGADFDKGLIESVLSQGERQSYKLIIAIGGGSVIDAAKLIAAALGSKISIEKLVENIKLKNNENSENNLTPKRLLVLPTTFGTGSDVNNCTHIGDGKAKISIRHNCFTPWVSLTIAEIALELPQKIRYLTALDAWVHAIESNTLKCEYSPLQKILAKESLHLHKKSFGSYIENPSINNAVDIAAVSCLAGLCLNNSRTGLIHTLATPFAKITGFNHAESLLPFIKPVLNFNWPGIQAAFSEVNREEFLHSLENTYLVLANQFMQNWTRKYDQKNIEYMVDQCLMDTVIFKENPVPLEKSDLKALYNEALQRWLV